MGCGCGKKQVAQKTAGQQNTKQVSKPATSSAKTPLQVRKERVNKLVSIPGTKPR